MTDKKSRADMVFGRIEDIKQRRRLEAKYKNLDDKYKNLDLIKAKKSAFLSGVDAFTKRALAQIDKLTGLLNRRAGEEGALRIIQTIGRYNEKAERRAEQCVAVIFMDLDYFKNVNDTYGHKTGDLVLKETARRINSCIRQDSTQIACRFGGEEFVVAMALQTETDTKTNKTTSPMEQAMAIAERIRSAVEIKGVDVTDLMKETKPLKQTVSVGVALGRIAGDDDRTAESIFTEVCKKADKALYSAKDSGRNCVCVSEDTLLEFGPSGRIPSASNVFPNSKQAKAPSFTI